MHRKSEWPYTMLEWADQLNEMLRPGADFLNFAQASAAEFLAEVS